MDSTDSEPTANQTPLSQPIVPSLARSVLIREHFRDVSNRAINVNPPAEEAVPTTAVQIIAPLAAPDSTTSYRSSKKRSASERSGVSLLKTESQPTCC